jgi:hypothetical protein
MVQSLNRISADNYPESLGIMFIINAPTVFKGFWDFLKTFLDPETSKKIKVLGSSYKKELLEVQHAHLFIQHCIFHFNRHIDLYDFSVY